MAETELHKWPLPEITAKANVPVDLKALADAMDQQVPYTCTSSTRPANPKAGLIIYETNTKRTYIGTGSGWAIMGQDWVKYTPVFTGATNWGTNAVRTGQYCVGPGGMVTAQMRIQSGTGASLGTGRIDVTLPVPTQKDERQVQTGTAIFLLSGPQGNWRNGIFAIGGNAPSGEVFVPQGATPFVSPGKAGMPWQSGSELHIAVTYASNLAVSVM